jgi:hypothetical protein
MRKSFYSGYSVDKHISRIVFFGNCYFKKTANYTVKATVPKTGTAAFLDIADIQLG